MIPTSHIAIIDTRGVDSPRVLGVGRTEQDARAASGNRPGRPAPITPRGVVAVVAGRRVALVDGVICTPDEALEAAK